METVENLLAPIAGAVTKLGATLTVKSAGDEPGLVEILYKGPENVGCGVGMPPGLASGHGGAVAEQARKRIPAAAALL